MRKFTLFFNLGSRAGVTESFYSALPSASWNGIISDYITARLALADSYFAFKYCRISQIPQNRKVSWRSSADFGNPVGSWGGSTDSAPEQALLLRLTMADDSSGRIFLHGFPRSMFDGEVYTPTPAYTVAVQRFVATIANGNYQYRMSIGHLITDRIGISAYLPVPPRGTTLTLAEPLSITPGNRVEIGGVGPNVIGLKGRKVVIQVNSPTSIVIGGGTPIGNPSSLSPGAYMYTVNDDFQVQAFGEVENLTTHKVGRPFGVKVGRQKNVVLLR